jgi:hypothetical protein
MSNCIKIHNYAVHFYPDEFDIKSFKKEIEEHKSHDILQVEDTFCWFLRDNSSVLTNGVVIEFGQGRSSHTYRDFKQTVRHLSKFMLRDKVCTFDISTEGDGFDQISKMRVRFSKNPNDVMFDE